jgi:hypothetical protein
MPRTPPASGAFVCFDTCHKAMSLFPTNKSRLDSAFYEDLKRADAERAAARRG